MNSMQPLQMTIRPPKGRTTRDRLHVVVIALLAMNSKQSRRMTTRLLMVRPSHLVELAPGISSKHFSFTDDRFPRRTRHLEAVIVSHATSSKLPRHRALTSRVELQADANASLVTNSSRQRHMSKRHLLFKSSRKTRSSRTSEPSSHDFSTNSLLFIPCLACEEIFLCCGLVM